MDEVMTTRRTLGDLRADCSRPADIRTLVNIGEFVLVLFENLWARREKG